MANALTHGHEKGNKLQIQRCVVFVFGVVLFVSCSFLCYRDERSRETETIQPRATRQRARQRQPASRSAVPSAFRFTVRARRERSGQPSFRPTSPLISSRAQSPAFSDAMSSPKRSDGPGKGKKDKVCCPLYVIVFVCECPCVFSRYCNRLVWTNPCTLGSARPPIW